MSRGRTDADGRFLLEFVPEGKSVLRIDGRHGGADGSVDYGTYEVQVRAVPGVVTPLPFTSWLTPIDHANDIQIASPTMRETVVTSPRLPGFQMIIPAGTILTDWDGKRINRISLTPVRADRPPFPLPREVMFNDYFTAQPGGTKLWTVTGQRGAAKVIYPNHGNGLPGARSTFWHYHPETVGWLPYGHATVSADGKSVVPDEGVTVYDFMGGGKPTDSGTAAKAQTPAGGQSDSSKGGDPVDLASGLFSRSMTDLSISDILPISLTRSYMSSDANYRDFGLGMSLSYEMFPELTGGSTGTAAAEEYSQLVIETPTSGIAFQNTTPAYGDFSDALFVAQTQPGPFLGAQATWTGNGFAVKQRNGMLYAFGYHSPLTYMQDRFGNRVSLTYEQVGLKAGKPANRVVRVTSPSGRFIQFTWADLYPQGQNGSYASPTGTDIYVIQSAIDNLGRQVAYTYDSCGRLTAVKDPHAIGAGLSDLTTLTWTTSAPALGAGACPKLTGANAPLNLLASINDQSTNLIVRNDQYEWSYQIGNTTYTSPYSCETPISGGALGTVVNGRVCHQQLAPPNSSGFATYSYAYKNVDANENIGQTVVTDPRSNTHVVNFQPPSQQAGVPTPAYSPGYPISETYAANDNANAQTWSYQRDPATSTLLQVTAPVLTEEGESAGRVTAFCYDNTTYLGSTASGSPLRPWNLTSVVRNLQSGSNACPSTVPTGGTSPTQNATTLFTYSPLYNLVTSITDPNNHTTTFCRISGQANCPSQTYTLEEAASVIDANGNPTSIGYRFNGQVLSSSRVASTANSTQTIQTAFSYDHDDLASVTGTGSMTAPQVAGRVSTIYTDAVGRSIQQTDPLGNISTTAYDPVFGPTQVTDANGTFENFAYNSNGNLFRAFQPKGTIQFAYNAANLVTGTTDPLNAQASSYYDASQNLTCTIDRNGNQANFTYDSLNRRTKATYYVGSTSGCAGTPGTVDSIVTYGYDHGNRVLTITDLAGGTLTRQFDDLDRMTSDAQTQAGSGAAIGTTTYTYDIGGRLISLTPTNVTPQNFVYDQGNRLAAIIRTNGSTVCFNYDTADRRTSVVYPSSTTANYSFDSLSDTLAILYSWKGQYTPGAPGTPITSGTPGTCMPGTNVGPGTGNLSYSYDQDGRQIGRGGSFFTFVPPSPFAPSTVSYNADNQLTLWNGLYNFYDPNGNLTCAGSSSSTAPTAQNPCPGQAFTWDARQRMITAGPQPGVSGALAESYVYDGLSRRQSVAVPSAATKATYLYSGLNPVSINTANTGSGATVDRTNILTGLGLDERYTILGSSAANSGSVITDIQGSTVQIEANLTTEVAYAYPPFGSSGAPSATSLNPFRYTGREASDNTGLTYLRGRYYAPQLSRFVSEDPLGLVAGPNIYAYVGNDPLNAIDPTGQFLFLITGGVGAAVGGLADLGHQLYANGGNFGQVSWGEVGVSAAFGGLAGAGLPFVGSGIAALGGGALSQYAGAAALGAAVNTGQYLTTNAINGTDSTIGGALFSAGTGALGGLAGGPISNPYMFTFISPFSQASSAAIANTTVSTVTRNLAGDIISGLTPPAQAATNPNCQ